MRITAVVAIALASLLAVGLLHDAPATLAGPNCTIDATLDSEELEFLQLINDYREQNGVAPLKLSDTLISASAWKSWHLGTEDYFAHDDTPINRTWVERLRDCGYTYNAWLGENIAAGRATAQEAFEQWRNSPGHNANMLSENYTAIGIGRHYVEGSSFGWYWTTAFGSYSDGYTEPAPPPGSDPEPCLDMTGDGLVRVEDALYVIERYGTDDTSADVTGDGSVRVVDVLAVMAQFGRDC